MDYRYKRIVFHNIVRYLIGFLVIFVSSIFVANTARESIKKYVIEQTKTRISEGINVIEESIDKMDMISQMLCRNSDFVSLIYTQGDIVRNSILKVRNSNDMLVRTGYISEYTPYMFVLFKNNGLYLSSGQCSLDFESYYDKFLKLNIKGEEALDAGEIKELLFKTKSGGQNFLKLDSASYIYDNGRRVLDEGLLYLGNTDYAEHQAQYIFGFLLDQEFIKKSILVPELEERSFLYIYDGKSGDVLMEAGKIPEGIEVSAADTIVGDGERYQIVENNDNEIGWHIITGVPNSFIEDQMRPVNRLLVIYLGLGFAVMLLFTLYYSLERYRGFQKVMRIFLKDDQETISGRISDDYKILRDRVIHLHEKGKDYQVEIEKLKRQNQAILVEGMIVKGIYTEKEQKLFEEKLGKEPDFFCVCVVHYQDAEASMMEDIALAVRESLYRNKIDIFTNVHSGAFEELYVIPLLPEQTVSAVKIQRAFENTITEISGKYDVIFHVGISAIGTGMKNLNQCYEQARRIVQIQNTFENGNAVKCHDISVNALHENPITLEQLNHLYTLLVCGQQEDAKKKLRQIQGIYERMPYLYEGYKEQIFYSLRNVFFSVMLHLNCENSEKNIPVFNKDMGCKEMIAMFENCTVWICDYIIGKRKSRNEQMKEKILLCIQENFQNPSISAAVVSSQAGISEKYLTQFLKEHTGETFASYLLHMRIDKAKEYLQETGYSNEQIAESVGFGTVNTFYRNFKKVVGITPNLYRERGK